MEELTIEEKAQRYDEAIERANELLYVSDKESLQRKTVEHIFPELAESEDKKIRNFISNELACLRATDEKGSDRYEELTNAIAWLEKPTDKAKPKFNVGDWIVEPREGEPNGLWHIERIEDNHYWESTTGVRIEHADRYYHPWTIQDAKDGDVLVHNGCTFIFMGIKENIVMALEENLINGTNPVCFGEADKDNDYYPATKEQRDTLMKSIANAGYTFDFEKKELKEVEPKHALSEEDERVTKWVIDYIGNCPNESFDFYGGVGKEAVLSWLNKLKDILQPQPRQEWKQENTCDLTDFENAMMHIGESFFGKNAGLDPNDTNAIKEQANILLELLPRQEWSEEDDYNLQCIIAKVTSDIQKGNVGRNNELIDWLKSIKDKVQPQPNQEWSEEDTDMFGSILSTLSMCINNTQIPADNRKIIKNEYEWFNKLYDRCLPNKE